MGVLIKERRRLKWEYLECYYELAKKITCFTKLCDARHFEQREAIISNLDYVFDQLYTHLLNCE
jgi:hypothetical protein